MAGGFFGNFVGNTKSGFNKLTNLNVGDMDWEEWGALAVTAAITIGILSALFSMIKSFWEENKSLIIMIGLVALAVVGIPWLMKQFGGKGEVQEAAAPTPARRGAGRPVDDDLMPNVGGPNVRRQSLIGDDAVGAPRLTDAAWRDVRTTHMGNVEYSDFLPLNAPDSGLAREIAQLKAREHDKAEGLRI